MQVTDALGGITRFQYDNLGQLTRSTDPEGFHTHYAYDNLGRLIQRSHPDAGTTAYAYDPAGNITKQTTPLGEINFDYTYYRLTHKRYSNMDGNNVAYTYHLGGRIESITDGTGHRKLGYDALGNLVYEHRILSVPHSNYVYGFETSHVYDSWGRMLQITYPDGEKVDYTYQWGGDLVAMTGTKGTSDTAIYIRNIQYDSLGQRRQIHYGNGTKADYTYDPLHRLSHLVSRDSLNRIMQNITYTFDSIGNISKIKNNATAIGTLGGSYENIYIYDPLHRLITAGGSGSGTSFRHGAKFSSSSRIGLMTLESHPAASFPATSKIYAYCDDHQPHAPRRILDQKNHQLYALQWDDAGNLGQAIQIDQWHHDYKSRFLYWTEDNRLHTVVDDRHHSYYAYDHAGERTLKLTGYTDQIDINADYMHTSAKLFRCTLYPSPYMVFTNHGYTKHYYAGTERLAARVGGGFGRNIAYPDPKISDAATDLFKQCKAQIPNRQLPEPPRQCIRPLVEPMHPELLHENLEHIPRRLVADAYVSENLLIDEFQGFSGNEEEPDVYFYHSDHLGSASWITDGDGIPVQHLQYLPYGEPFVNQRAAGSTYSERFRFTGKERDEETGYGYFGARYMDHELMTMWLSVDPLADKYPNISPYNYCMWNPIKLVDPDGRDGRVIIHNEGEKKTITIQTTVHLKTAKPNQISESTLKRYARNYTDAARRKLKQREIDGIIVRFDIQYKLYDEKKGISEGDNIMILDPSTPGRSETAGTKWLNAAGMVEERTTGNRSMVLNDDIGSDKSMGVLHETLHLLGLSDRYHGFNSSFPGYEKDIMGGSPRYASGLHETHYQNYIDFFSDTDMEGRPYILLNKMIDVKFTENLNRQMNLDLKTLN